MFKFYKFVDFFIFFVKLSNNNYYVIKNPLSTKKKMMKIPEMVLTTIKK